MSNHNRHIYESKGVYENEDTLRSCIVNRALQVCINLSNHHIFFDNVFKSYKLLVQLHKTGNWANEILQNGWIADCPLTLISKMKKSKRSVFDYRLSSDQIEIVQWNDKLTVTVGSNAYEGQPMFKIKRWVKGKGRIDVKQPAIVG